MNVKTRPPPPFHTAHMATDLSSLEERENLEMDVILELLSGQD